MLHFIAASTAAAGLVLALSITGCDRSAPPAPPSEGPAPGGAGGAIAEDEAPAPHGPAIYFVHQRGGMTMLRSDGFERLRDIPSLTLERAPLRLPGGGFLTYHTQMVAYDGTVTELGSARETQVSQPQELTADGKLLATGTTTVGVHDGEAWEVWDLREVIDSVPGGRTTGSAAFGPDGTLYVTIPAALAVRSPGGEWVAHELPIVNSNGQVGVGADGLALVSLLARSAGGQAGAFVFDGAGFRRVARHWFHRPFVVRGGVIHALRSDGRVVVRLVDGELETLHTHRGRLTQLQLGADGHLYALDMERRQVLRFDEAGVTHLPSEANALPFALSSVHDNYDVDGRGRVWLRSRYGVHLIDGDTVTDLLPGGDSPLSGLIERVVVSGSGPDELPELVSSGRITVSGAIVGGDGAPAAGVSVEICALYASRDRPTDTATFRGRTPCAKSDQVFGRTTTDEAGRYSVEGMPRLGTISIAYRDGRDWAQFLPRAGRQSCAEVLDGETCDVGTIRLSP